MTARFVLRWTLVGLLAAIPLLALAYLLSLLQPAPPLVQRIVSVDDLLSAVEMPLDASGAGTQVISNTTLVLRVQPYPPRASTTSTLTLVALTSDGKSYHAADPSLRITGASQVDVHEYPLSLQDDGSYGVSGKFFSVSGQYRLRLDVYLGDANPANMIFTVNAISNIK